uniref:Uncharacterized protein n=1 Tax=Anguilla anguilla TaxID=7936 RepID=A0A0E9QTA4_ANGAN
MIFLYRFFFPLILKANKGKLSFYDSHENRGVCRRFLTLCACMYVRMLK